jgi:hypothetical protein
MVDVDTCCPCVASIRLRRFAAGQRPTLKSYQLQGLEGCPARGGAWAPKGYAARAGCPRREKGNLLIVASRLRALSGVEAIAGALAGLGRTGGSSAFARLTISGSQRVCYADVHQDHVVVVMVNDAVRESNEVALSGDYKRAVSSTPMKRGWVAVA